MQRFIVTTLGCLLTLGLAACDKSADSKKSVDSKKSAEAKQPADSADKPADANEAKADEAKPAEDEQAVVDDTKGLGTVVREVAGDKKPADKPPEASPDAPHYDTSKDAGGLIGHLASGLAHDEELGDAPTVKELAKLAGESADAPSDAALCKHVWTEVFLEAYPKPANEAEQMFMHACKAEVERGRVKLGVEVFAQHASCVLAAKDLAGLDLCDLAEQEAEDALHQHPHGDGSAQAACVAAVEHMFILITREMAGDPDLLETLEEDIYAIKDDAVLACRDEATKAELACVMKAADLKGLEACR